MSITNVLAFPTGAIVLSAISYVPTPELSLYRGMRFGASVATVAEQCHISPEPRIVDRRPDLIQELMWMPARVEGTAGDPVQKVLFTFYNDRLARIAVSYDRSRTEGLTVEDLIEGISANYGATAVSAVGPAGGSSTGNVDDRILARWEDAETSITLFRSKYLSTFGLVLLSKRLDALTTVAHAEAILLDEREAPAREVARQQQRSDDDRLKEEAVRRVNKAAFKP
jgi:hypothetical protein